MENNTSSKATLAQAVQFFLTPRKPQNPVPLELPQGKNQSLTTPEGDITIQRAGTGPRVMLIHGWEGQASDLSAFALALLEAGFEVLAVHLPAHGESSGAQTSIPHSARALRAVGEVVGPLHAAVAHSMGSAILVEAMQAGLTVNQVVLIAAPAHYENYARAVAAALALDTDSTNNLFTLISEQIGTDIREVSLPRRALSMRQPALFIHSSDDRVVTINDSLASADVWPNAQHIRVENLGHKRILADASVIAAALAFLPHPNTVTA